MKTFFRAACRGLAVLVVLAVCAPVHVHANDEGRFFEEQMPCDRDADAALPWDDARLEAGRGCCSWHGGMSGQCSGGRVVCNDGTLSPSCTCRASAQPAKDA